MSVKMIEFVMKGMIDLHIIEMNENVFQFNGIITYGDIRASGIVDSYHVFEKFRTVTVAILSIARMSFTRLARGINYPVVVSDKEKGMDHFMLEEVILVRTSLSRT